MKFASRVGRALGSVLVILLVAAVGTGSAGRSRPHTAAVPAAFTVQKLGRGRLLLSVGLPTWANDYPWLGDSSQGYVGIHHDADAPEAWGFDTNLGGNPGLWLFPLGAQRYTPGQAEFTYTAPGTTRLASASLDIAYRNKVLAHHCLNVGLRAGDQAIDADDYCKPVSPPDSQADFHVDLTDPAASPTATQLFFQLAMPGCVAGPCAKYIPALDPLKNGGYARLKSLSMVLVDDDDPIVDATGQLPSLADSYIDGRQSYAVTVSTHDPGAGMASASLDANGAPILDRTAPCDPTHNTLALDDRICPEYFEFSDTVDTSPLPEGTNTFVAQGADVAGNTGSSISWQLWIDRTPPAAVSNVRLNAYDASSGTADVAWDGGDDPALPDGTPGSGTQTFQYRYGVDGGGFTDWAESDVPDFRAPAQIGDVLDVQVRGVDGVGNEADPTSASVTVYDAGGELYPYSSATEDPNTVNTLTAAQTQAATQIAETSSAVRDVVGSRALTASDFQPWAAGGGDVVGTTFTLSWAGPATLNGPWLSLDAGPDGTGSTTTQSYEADDVTSVDVTVDLRSGAVVEVNPGLNSTVPDDPEPTSLPATPQFSTKALADAGTARPVRNLRLITNHLVPGVGNDSWWNWDFNTESVSPYKSTGGVNVDMPISLVFWGDVDVATAKDMWNRGQADTKLFASPMHELVHDRLDPGQPAAHKEPAKAVWDSDRGSYLGRFAAPACRMHVKWHYRVYAPGSGSGGDDRLYSPAWGYYVIASSHIDYKEGCSDGWSGDTEVTEHRLAAESPTHTQQHYSLLFGCSTSSDPWTVEDAQTREQQTDTLNLHNRDEVGFSLDHKHLYLNDGMATMIHVPNVSHPLWICNH